MIRYVSANQKDWDKHLPLLIAAYRSTPHSLTRFTPNMLMLGREVHQPVDIQLQAYETSDIYNPPGIPRICVAGKGTVGTHTGIGPKVIKGGSETRL